jgi:hypothetical protein
MRQTDALKVSIRQVSHNFGDVFIIQLDQWPFPINLPHRYVTIYKVLATLYTKHSILKLGASYNTSSCRSSMHY